MTIDFSSKHFLWHGLETKNLILADSCPNRGMIIKNRHTNCQCRFLCIRQGNMTHNEAFLTISKHRISEEGKVVGGNWRELVDDWPRVVRGVFVIFAQNRLHIFISTLRNGTHCGHST